MDVEGKKQQLRGWYVMDDHHGVVCSWKIHGCARWEFAYVCQFFHLFYDAFGLNEFDTDVGHAAMTSLLMHPVGSHTTTSML